jgi:TolA-binding protein
MTHLFHHRLAALAIAATMVGAAPQAGAQDAGIAPRVDKLEKEMRAVQRKVFPGADGTFFEPDITPQQPVRTGQPSSAPLSDIMARLDALEAQLASVTGQVENLGNRQRIMSDEFAAYKSATDRRIADLAPAAATPAAASSDGTADVTTTKPSTAKPAAAKPAANDARIARVRAIEVPDTGDKGEDAYLYGYRLWDAQLYPEAQIQLKKAVAAYPKHRRVSFAQNLLGRAYLDNGENGLAAKAFMANYQERADSARAPDSLMYLGVALTRLKQKDAACRAFKELDQVYGATISPSLKAEAAKARATAGCS